MRAKNLLRSFLCQKFPCTGDALSPCGRGQMDPQLTYCSSFCSMDWTSVWGFWHHCTAIFPLLFLSAGRNRTPLQKVSCLLTLEEFLVLIISKNNIRDAYIQAKSPQSRPILCDPRDSTLPGSSVHGTLQAGILGWAAMPSSSGSSWPRDGTCVSYVSCIGRPVLDH